MYEKKILINKYTPENLQYIKPGYFNHNDIITNNIKKFKEESVFGLIKKE